MWEKGVKGSVKDAAVALSLKQRTSVFQLRSQVGTTPTCMCAHHFCRAGSSAGNDRGTTERALLCAVEPPHSKKAHRFDSLFCVKFACFPRVCMGSFQVLRLVEKHMHVRCAMNYRHAQRGTSPSASCYSSICLPFFKVHVASNLEAGVVSRQQNDFFIPSSCQAKKQLQSI